MNLPACLPVVHSVAIAFPEQVVVMRANSETPFLTTSTGRNGRYAPALAGTAAGATLESCVRALSGFAAVKGRLQIKRSRQGAVLIDDTYNANPDSVRAAIDVLARTPGRKLLVLGDMGEVGDQGRDFHTEIGMYAHERGIDALYGLGELAAHAVRAFGEGARHYAAIETLLVDVGAALGPQATVLVKGSRFMQMERVVRSFEDSTAGA